MAKRIESTFYIREWCDKVEIDYFASFVKAYIPFNAWMNDHCKPLKNDRDMLEKVKTTANTFRDKIGTLLERPDQDGVAFRNSIGELHDALERSTVSSHGEKITFQAVPRLISRKPSASNTRNGVTYTAQWDGSLKQVTIEVTKKGGKKTAQMQFPSYPSDDDIKGHGDFKKLTEPQKDELLAVVHQIDPDIRQSLLYSGEKKNGGIQCGAFKMTDEKYVLAAGIVETLYNLRCALFHGSIDPNKDANRVYGAAYQVLYPLIRSLV